MIIAISLLVFLAAIALVAAFALRVVVPTNDVHIVQSGNQTKSYGAGKPLGNAYYKIPSFIPKFGVVVTVLPVSIFDVDLLDYEAYDQGRLPFNVDIKAFFRINDSDLAAQRAASFDQLRDSLSAIVQSAVRTILAKSEIEEIMQERSTFGTKFTEEVDANLANWGVISVKNIELMDIRDSGDNTVIENIMEKKKSLIEKESRVEVANNMKDAEVAEIEAARITDLERQVAEQSVGIRTAEKRREVGIANEQADQQIKDAQLITTQKAIGVAKAEEVGRAEISRESQVVKANETRQITEIVAEGEKNAKVFEAEGIKTIGEAEASAKTAILLAPVTAQITLAKEIGENDAYQNYLMVVEAIEASKTVGTEQAKALVDSDLKVIVNAGETTGGVNKVMDIFSPKGGTGIAGMLEALANGDQGKALLERFGGLAKPNNTDGGLTKPNNTDGEAA